MIVKCCGTVRQCHLEKCDVWWNSGTVAQCHSDSKVWWKSGTVGQCHKDMKVW